MIEPTVFWYSYIFGKKLGVISPSLFSHIWFDCFLMYYSKLLSAVASEIDCFNKRHSHLMVHALDSRSSGPGWSQCEGSWMVYSRLQLMSSSVRLSQPCKRKQDSINALQIALLSYSLGETHEFWLKSCKTYIFKRAIPNLWCVVPSLICWVSWQTLV